MPWGIFKEGELWCIHKLTDDNKKGEKVACHETETEAHSHLAALNAAEVESAKSIYLGGGIKMVSDNRFGGYLIVFGDSEHKDLQGEYFTPETQLDLEWYDTRPALFHHGLDASVKTATIGQIDALKTDDVGLWAEGILNERNQYVGAIRQLIAKGALAWSSGSVPHLVEVATDGRIKRWPVIEGSLTPTPAEPRNTGIQSIKSYKHYLETLLEANTLGKDVKGDDKQNEHVTKHTIKMGENPMAPEELREFVQQIVAEMMETMKQADDDIMEEDEEVMKDAMTKEAEDVVKEGENTLRAMDEELDGSKASKLIMAGNTRIIKAAYAEVAQRKATKAKATQQAILAAKNAAMNATPAATAQERIGAGGTKSAHISVRSRRHDNMDAADMAFLHTLVTMQRNTPGVQTSKYWNWDIDKSFMNEMADKATKEHGDRLPASAIKGINAVKADELDYSTQALYGDDWVPTLTEQSVWNTTRLDNVLLPNLRNIEMPSNPFDLPVEGTDGTVFFVPETQDESELTISGSGAVMPDTKIGTAKVTLTAKKLALRFGYSAELGEDAIREAIPQFRRQAVRNMQDAMDSVGLNGDTAASGNINLDGGTPAATANYKAFNSIIKDALLGSSGGRAVDMGGIAPTLAKIREARFKLSNAKSHRPQDLMIVCDASTWNKLLNLDEYLTIDKAGPLATAQQGTLGFVDNIPVFVSNEMAVADTDGKITSGGNVTDTGRLLFIHKPSWVVGYRRQLSQSLTFIPYYDAWQLVVTARYVVNGQNTTDSSSILYNIGI